MTAPFTLLIGLDGIRLLLLQGTLLLAAALLANRARRRAPAARRHLSLALALASFLALPVLHGLLPRVPVIVPVAAPASAPALPAGGASRLAPRDAAPPDAAPLVRSPRATDSRRSLDAVPSASTLWPLAPGALWALGALVVLLRTAAGMGQLCRLVRRAEPVRDGLAAELHAGACQRLGLPRAPRLVWSDDVEVPLVFGFSSPTVVLPRAAAAWSRERLSLALLHENGHVSRRDHAVQLLARAVTGLYWFHPLVWIAERARRREAERASDDLVLRSGVAPSVYASHLVSIAAGLTERTPTLGAVAMASRRGPLSERIRAILDPSQARTAGPSLPAGILLALLLTPLASLRLMADDGRDATAEPRSRHHAHGHHAEDCDERGLELYEDGDYRAAIEAFEDCVARGEDAGTALYNIACCHALNGDAARALSHLEKAVEAGFDDVGTIRSDDDLRSIRRDPRFEAAARKAAEMDGGGERTAALARLDRLERSPGATGEAFHAVGTELLMVRELPAAVRALQRAAELEPDRAEAWYNLACAHSLAGAATAALDALAASIDAGYGDRHHLEQDTDLDGVRADPRYAELEGRAETLSVDRFQDEGRRREWADAIAALEAFVAREPGVGRAWFALGWGHHASGVHAKAAGEFARAGDLGFRPGVSCYNAACAEARQGNADAAFAWLARAEGAGFHVGAHAAHDPDLDSLRADARFAPYRESASWRGLRRGLDVLRMLL